MTYHEALGVVFPLLNGRDLASCMLVCKQWRDLAGDDYFWKCLCAKRWPSICKRPTPLPVSYRELFQMFSKRCTCNPDPLPIASYDDLEFYIDMEFYIDIWDGERLIFSEVVRVSVLVDGINDLPPDVSEMPKSYLDYLDYLDSPYKLITSVEPKLSILSETIFFSVLVGRMDTNKLACIFEKRECHDHRKYLGFAPDNLDFAPTISPIKLNIRSWLTSLGVEDEDDLVLDVFGFALEFGNAVGDRVLCEVDFFSLLHLLRWC